MMIVTLFSGCSYSVLDHYLFYEETTLRNYVVKNSKQTIGQTLLQMEATKSIITFIMCMFFINTMQLFKRSRHKGLRLLQLSQELHAIMWMTWLANQIFLIIFMQPVPNSIMRPIFCCIDNYFAPYAHIPNWITYLNDDEIAQIEETTPSIKCVKSLKRHCNELRKAIQNQDKCLWIQVLAKLATLTENDNSNEELTYIEKAIQIQPQIQTLQNSSSNTQIMKIFTLFHESIQKFPKSRGCKWSDLWRKAHHWDLFLPYQPLISRP